jgi:hypothetical protein
MAWRGVRRLPWLERLLDFDKVEALFITGPLKVVVSQYCFRTALPVNHGSALRASKVESRLVSDMRKSATQLPAIVNMRKHDRTIPLALDHVRFWQLPFDKQSFNNDPHCVAAALNLELIVTLAFLPVFYVGGTKHPSPIEDFPLTKQTDCSDAALYQRVEEHFHQHAMITFNAAAGPHGNWRLRLPNLWGRIDGADRTVFSVIPTPESLARLMDSWLCISPDIGNKITPWRSHLLVGDSVLKQVYNALPRCPGAVLSVSASTDPLEVPIDTPATILQLALDLRIDECGCDDCLDLRPGRTWSIGPDVRGCPGPGRDAFLFMCFNDPAGPRVRLVEEANVDVDITSLHWVQAILHCLSKPAQDYLLNFFYRSDPIGMSPLLMRLCDITYNCATTGPMLPWTDSVIPLHRNEFRYNNSHLRFIWKHPAPQPHQHVTGRKRKNERAGESTTRH